MIKKLLNKKIGRENKKGFTLAELLIVVAIIGVLVAVSIPIFTSQLEKSKEATDIANVRSAYAEVVTQYLADGDNDYSMTVAAKQTQDGWQGNSGILTIQNNGSQYDYPFDAVTSGNNYTVEIDASGSVTIS